jgi:hypothetical protein
MTWFRRRRPEAEEWHHDYSEGVRVPEQRTESIDVDPDWYERALGGGAPQLDIRRLVFQEVLDHINEAPASRADSANSMIIDSPYLRDGLSAATDDINWALNMLGPPARLTARHGSPSPHFACRCPMSQPQQLPGSGSDSARSSWENLDPWEKAARWRRTAPELAEQVVKLATSRALQQIEQNQQDAELRRDLSRQQQRHAQQMEKRLWWSQIIGIVGGLLCIAGLILVAWRYGASGNIGAAVGVFGMGAGLTAGVFGASTAIAKKLRPGAGGSKQAEADATGDF